MMKNKQNLFICELLNLGPSCRGACLWFLRLSYRIFKDDYICYIYLVILFRISRHIIFIVHSSFGSTSIFIWGALLYYFMFILLLLRIYHTELLKGCLSSLWNLFGFSNPHEKESWQNFYSEIRIQHLFYAGCMDYWIVYGL